MTLMSRLTITSAAEAGTPVWGGILQRKCACGRHAGGGECEECKKKKRLQRQRSHGAETAEVPSVVHEVLRSSAQPLDARTRNFMEPRFGRDFSQVRVHDDGRAAFSAKAVGALAYTVGNNVVFGSGQYAPETPRGRELLAHELTHVVQQSATPAGGALTLDNDAGAEREADAMARSAASGEPLAPPSAMGHGLQRQRLPVDERDLDAPHGPRRGRSGASARFLECVKEEGEQNRQRCREKHLGVPGCPSTYTIPDDVYMAIGKAWKKSGHGGRKVAEQGGIVVTDDKGKRKIRTGSGESGSITFPKGKPGEVIEGSFHTHPYSKDENSELGVSFSGTDVQNSINGRLGSVQYIGAGTCYFILNTLDTASRDDCKTKDIKKRWDDSFAAATGTLAERAETAVKVAITDCGLCYYKTCRPDDKSPVPKTADLV
jgi:Domain of unknown function (DUF4157)